MTWVEPVVLERGDVRLVPLGLEHVDGLAAAARDGELWKLAVTTVPAPGEEEASVREALAAEDRLAFAVLDADGALLGSTSYHDILPPPRRLMIGWTWYARRVQRTRVNTTCKLLLLQHAFDTLGARTVGWQTDVLNLASQRAIERLGAQRDGVLRGDRVRRDGTVRDTVHYSLTADEWPAVRSRLEARLAG